MSSKILTTILMYSLLGSAPAQTPPVDPPPPPPPPPPASSKSVYHVGHSLVGPTMPRMLENIAESLNQTHAYISQNIPGASLQYNWNSCVSGGSSTCAVAQLPNTPHDVLVITEAVPLLNHTTDYNSSDGVPAGSYNYSLRFYNLQQQTNPGGEVYLYETWHCTASGTPEGCAFDGDDDNSWRQRLDDSFSVWNSIVDYVNSEKTSGPAMKLLPAGQAMAKLYDEIEAGSIPGMTTIDDVFADGIHLNDIGNYFVALVHFASIYNASPVGATRITTDRYGGTFDSPTAAQAARLQDIAWQVVADHRRND